MRKLLKEDFPVSEVFLTEDQQLETLKNFWKEYGFSIISGVILAIVLGFGWRFLNAYIDQRAENAALIYQHLVTAVTNQQAEEAKKQAEILQKKFGSTPYGDLGKLFLAKVALENHQPKEAIPLLNQVVKHGHMVNIKKIARLRLARVYLSLHDINAALDVLSAYALKKGIFRGAAAEIQGDIYREQGNKSLAKTAYQEALLLLPAESISRPLLTMKLNDLGV